MPALRDGRWGWRGGLVGALPASARDMPSNVVRSLRMPASMRVLTVPSGVSVSPAISRWV